MFGISFGELMIIAVVGLVVIGPERLPAVARALGSLLRQVQDYTNAFKSELNRELHNAEILKLEQEMKAEGRNLQVSLTEEFSQVQQELEHPDWHAGVSRPAPTDRPEPGLAGEPLPDTLEAPSPSPENRA